MYSDMILRESMVKSTKILAGKNIRVLMEGFAPHVKFDVRTRKPVEIVLPMIPDSCPMDLVNAIKGYQDHEAGHVLYSSHEDICDNKKSSLWHYLHNVVDDNHVNAKMGKDFPGTHVEILAGYKYIFNKMPQYDHSHIEKLFATNEKEATAGYIVSWVAHKMNSDFVSDWYETSPLPKLMKKLDDKLPASLKYKFENCETPADVRATTDELLEFMKDMDLAETLEKQAEQDSKSKGKGKEGEKGKGKGAGGKPEEGKGKDKGKGEGEYDEDAPAIDTKDLPGSFEDALSGLIGRNIEIEFKRKSGTFFWSERMNEVIDAETYKGNARVGGRAITDTHGLDEFEKSCKEQSNYLRKRLERLLESRNRTYYTGGFKSGKLNGKQLASIPLGNTFVFAKKSEAKALNTAVGLLCDLSGSMSGSKVKLASQCTYTLADCLDKLKIPFEALGFWTDQPTTVKPGEVRSAWNEFEKEFPHVARNVVNPFATETTFVFKGFNEPFSLKHKATLMSASKGMIGLANNNDATHLKVALERLSKMPQEKKVLFVFSDGQPAFSHHDRHDNARSKLKELAHNSLKEYGVTVVGIGIQSDAPKHFYKNTKHITELKQLPTTVFEVLTKQLLERK